jgi:hypothetical protein
VFDGTVIVAVAPGRFAHDLESNASGPLVQGYGQSDWVCRTILTCEIELPPVLVVVLLATASRTMNVTSAVASTSDAPFQRTAISAPFGSPG